jgi:hypothetical protein
VIEGSQHQTAGRCLNCSVDLAGAFCAACGQRSAPANPTVAELAGDAWHELSGYDGRIAATFRNLLSPGRLTIDYLQGRRARYLSPIRLYLIVSVMYFVAAAAAPETVTNLPGQISGPGGMKIAVISPGAAPMTDQDLAELLKRLDTAPWFVRQMLSALLEDPAGFRTRLFTIMPRVFFAMLPVFAAVISVFYRKRRFPTVLVFAVHLHAFAFLIFTFSEAAAMTRSPIVEGVVGMIAVIGFSIYALSALRAVFGGRWPITIAKAAGIGFVYLIASMPAFVMVLFWASLA